MLESTDNKIPASRVNTESTKFSTIRESTKLFFGRAIRGVSDCAYGVAELAKKVFGVVQSAFSAMNEKVQQKFSQVMDINLHHFSIRKAKLKTFEVELDTFKGSEALGPSPRELEDFVNNVVARLERTPEKIRLQELQQRTELNIYEKQEMSELEKKVSKQKYDDVDLN